MQQTPRPQLSSLRMEKNPLQEALDNYQLLSAELADTRAQNARLRGDNAALVAEAGMLREHLRAADNDRVRLQAIASTMLGRLFSINDVISGAVRASIKEGIDAAKTHVLTEPDAMGPDEGQQAAQERTEIARPQTPGGPIASPAVSERPTAAILNSAEYRR